MSTNVPETVIPGPSPPAEPPGSAAADGTPKDAKSKLAEDHWVKKDTIGETIAPTFDGLNFSRPEWQARAEKQMIDAAGDGAVLIIKKLVRQGISTSCRDMFGNYPIHMAATGGHIEAIQLINKSNGYSDVDLKDKAGFTPLALAVSNQMTEAVIVLLLAGADPSIPLPDGSTLVSFARQLGVEELIRVLETPKEQLHYVSPPMPLPGTSPPPETSMPCTDFEITLFCETPAATPVIRCQADPSGQLKGGDVWIRCASVKNGIWSNIVSYHYPQRSEAEDWFHELPAHLNEYWPMLKKRGHLTIRGFRNITMEMLRDHPDYYIRNGRHREELFGKMTQAWRAADQIPWQHSEVTAKVDMIETLKRQRSLGSVTADETKTLPPTTPIVSSRGKSTGKEEEAVNESKEEGGQTRDDTAGLERVELIGLTTEEATLLAASLRGHEKVWLTKAERDALIRKHEVAKQEAEIRRQQAERSKREAMDKSVRFLRRKKLMEAEKQFAKEAAIEQQREMFRIKYQQQYHFEGKEAARTTQVRTIRGLTKRLEEVGAYNAGVAEDLKETITTGPHAHPRNRVPLSTAAHETEKRAWRRQLEAEEVTESEIGFVAKAVPMVEGRLVLDAMPDTIHKADVLDTILRGTVSDKRRPVNPALLGVRGSAVDEVLYGVTTDVSHIARKKIEMDRQKSYMDTWWSGPPGGSAEMEGDDWLNTAAKPPPSKLARVPTVDGQLENVMAEIQRDDSIMPVYTNTTSSGGLDHILSHLPQRMRHQGGGGADGVRPGTGASIRSQSPLSQASSLRSPALRDDDASSVYSGSAMSSGFRSPSHSRRSPKIRRPPVADPMASMTLNFSPSKISDKPPAAAGAGGKSFTGGHLDTIAKPAALAGKDKGGVESGPHQPSHPDKTPGRPITKQSTTRTNTAGSEKALRGTLKSVSFFDTHGSTGSTRAGRQTTAGSSSGPVETGIGDRGVSDDDDDDEMSFASASDAVGGLDSVDGDAAPGPRNTALSTTLPMPTSMYDSVIEDAIQAHNTSGRIRLPGVAGGSASGEGPGGFGLSSTLSSDAGGLGFRNGRQHAGEAAAGKTSRVVQLGLQKAEDSLYKSAEVTRVRTATAQRREMAMSKSRGKDPGAQGLGTTGGMGHGGSRGSTGMGDLHASSVDSEPYSAVMASVTGVPSVEEKGGVAPEASSDSALINKGLQFGVGSSELGFPSQLGAGGGARDGSGQAGPHTALDATGSMASTFMSASSFFSDETAATVPRVKRSQLEEAAAKFEDRYAIERYQTDQFADHREVSREVPDGPMEWERTMDRLARSSIPTYIDYGAYDADAVIKARDKMVENEQRRQEWIQKKKAGSALAQAQLEMAGPVGADATPGLVASVDEFGQSERQRAASKVNALSLKPVSLGSAVLGARKGKGGRASELTRARELGIRQRHTPPRSRLSSAGQAVLETSQSQSTPRLPSIRGLSECTTRGSDGTSIRLEDATESTVESPRALQARRDANRASKAGMEGTRAGESMGGGQQDMGTTARRRGKEQVPIHSRSGRLTTHGSVADSHPLRGVLPASGSQFGAVTTPRGGQYEDADTEVLRVSQLTGHLAFSAIDLSPRTMYKRLNDDRANDLQQIYDRVRR